MTEIITTI